jgi:hypothetical protein
MWQTPDPIGGNAVRVWIRRLALVPSQTDAIYLAFDRDLGSDPDRGPASHDRSASVNLRMLKFMFKNFFILIPDSSSLVSFLY